MIQNRTYAGLRRWACLCGIGLSLSLLLVAVAAAVSIHPQLKKELVADGRWGEVRQMMQTLQSTDNLSLARPTVAANTAAGFGTRIPVILVDFTDMPWDGGSANTSNGLIDSMIFTDGVFPTGSMRDYYQEASYGAYDIDGDVYGPYTLPQTYAYYAAGSHGVSVTEPNTRTIARDAFAAADGDIDFSLYDGDGDLNVDGVIIIFSGWGFEESGDEDRIQSHQWYLPSPSTHDGVFVSEYTIQPEEHGIYGGGGSNDVGVVCHEWGHILGLPDLYDLDGSSWGLGDWSLMASGNYNNNSATPAHFDPWCKIQLGWVDVDTLSANRTDQVIGDYATTSTVYRLWLSGISGNEYYLLVNRQQTGFDSGLPGSGLQIFHVDDLTLSNDNEYIPGEVGSPSQHYRVSLVQADGNYDLEKMDAGNPGDAGDLYTDQTGAFDDLTTPSSRAYGGLVTQVAVWNISAPGETMTANLDVSFSRPLLTLDAYYFDDPTGDMDEVPDPGESIDFYLTTLNVWKSTTDIELTVTCPNPAISFTNSTSHISLLETGWFATNYADPVQFTVAQGAEPTITDFYVNWTSEGGAFAFAEHCGLTLDQNRFSWSMAMPIIRITITPPPIISRRWKTFVCPTTFMTS